METATKRKVRKPAESPAPAPVAKTLVKYTLKAIIPTGPYANIQPEITVESTTLDEAHKLVMPYIDGLFKEYLNLSERAKPRVTVSVKDVRQEEIRLASLTEAHSKAALAIETSNSIEALDLIADRVAKSEKLTPVEKLDLNLSIATKRARLEEKWKKEQEIKEKAVKTEETLVDETNTPEVVS